MSYARLQRMKWRRFHFTETANGHFVVNSIFTISMNVLTDEFDGDGERDQDDDHPF